MQPDYVDKTRDGGGADTTAPGGRAQGVQALLNPARKAEQRLLRLRSAKAKTSAQFEAFLKGLKRAFVKEMSKFQTDTARLDQAIEDAIQEQDKAFATVRQAILGGAIATGSAEQPEQAAEQVWVQMRAHWEQEDGELLRDVLRGAVPSVSPAAPRQLTTEAQRLLEHHGATHAPAPSVPAGPPPQMHPMYQLSPELQQLLQHFAATGLPPGLATAERHGAEVVSDTDDRLGGLDPSLFEVSADMGAGMAAAERPPSSSISPGARARKALAPGMVPRVSVKTHTKPSATPAGQALAKKLEMVRAAAAQKEAVEQAGSLTTPTGMPAMTTPGAAPGQTSTEPTHAMRPFGRALVAPPPAPAPSANVDSGSRSIRIREANTEDEMDESQQDES